MENNFVLYENISYGSHERQKADVFVPDIPKSEKGVILFIHGGGWHDGDKSVHRADAEYFCRLGYISCSMNYRFVSEKLNIFNELDDITAAVEAIKNKCSELGFDVDKLLLSGGSAGAHLALMYAYTRKNEAPVVPVAVCAYCPPVDCAKKDFLLGISGEFEDWKYDILSKCCGYVVNKENLLSEASQKALKRISPRKYVTTDVVPTAVFAGGKDELIPFNHIENFIEILNTNKVENKFLIYENSGHALDKDPDVALQSKKIIKDYAETYF